MMEITTGLITGVLGAYFSMGYPIPIEVFK